MKVSVKRDFCQGFFYNKLKAKGQGLKVKKQPTPSLSPFTLRPCPCALCLFFTEHIGRKERDFRCRVAPGVGGKPRLAAGLLQERVPVPAVLRRHLGKEQARAAALADVEPMCADLDLSHVRDLAQRGED